MTFLAGVIFAFVLGVVVTAMLFRSMEESGEFTVPQTPRSTINDAQRAANISMCDQVVMFDGYGFRVVKANNQYSINGCVVHVAHPEAII